VSSVDRSLLVVETLIDAERPMTHADLARTLGIPKSTLTQLLVALQRSGYVGIDDRHYFPGVRLLSLGQRVAHSTHLRTAIRPLMDKLAVETGETVLLGSIARDHLAYVDQSPSPHPIRYVTTIGQTRPLHCTAAGRVLLAFNNRSAQSLGPLARFTARTVIDPNELDRILAQVRTNGYAINDGESVEGVVAIAAPIPNGTANPIAALGVTGPSQRLADIKERVLPLLRATIRRIPSSGRRA
jgi:IclR family transcriptional regulator, KDG regulon repressor